MRLITLTLSCCGHVFPHLDLFLISGPKSKPVNQESENKSKSKNVAAITAETRRECGGGWAALQGGAWVLYP